jgi:WXG100 family type VII secretion target
LTSFQTDVSTMDLAASRVFDVNERVQTQLASLLRRLDPLMGAWQGPAATSLQVLKDRWHDNATRLNQALRGIGEGLVRARQNYASSEEANQRGFTAIAGNLQ